MRTFEEYCEEIEPKIDPLEIAQKDFAEWLERKRHEMITEDAINFNRMSQIYRRFATKQGLQMASYAANEFIELACNLVLNHMDRRSKKLSEDYLRKLQEY